ncbi:MAG: acyl-CoA thioesterase II [Proteobacteria bacterium]|jgi:acyl-CoA thioesterase II|nr:acyl-CoA thioesterase II [Pseudomonadota bacterium]
MSVKLVEFLRTKQIGENTFRGKSRDLGTPQVYGGQVLGQAIHAAQMTIEERSIHSAHAYFLRRGDFNQHIDYQVERSRDGGSFSARRVEAIQHGRPIFNLSASFQKTEDGMEYAEKFEMPPGPDEIEVSQEELDSINLRSNILFDSAFSIRPVKVSRLKENAKIQFWIKTEEKLPDDEPTQRAVLAYISDFGLLAAATIPHGYMPRVQIKKTKRKLMMASIDHAIWFHRPLRMDEWHLFSTSPVSTSGARGLAQGRMFNQAGQLVTSTAQEGLMRQLV